MREEARKMTITAKYAGTCAACGGAIRVGDMIEWQRGSQPRHATCPQSVDPSAPRAEIQVSRGEGYGGRPYVVGQTMRLRDRRAVTVVSATQCYIREDGMSFGVGDEEGHIYHADCRLATEEETRDLVARELRATERRIAGEWLRALVSGGIGVYEEGEHILDGEEIAVGGTDTRIVGGGTWITICDDWNWFVRNNGADGDDWRGNNMRTCGAGARGYRVERDAELERWIREAARLAA
jgi:hypothetical protein